MSSDNRSVENGFKPSEDKGVVMDLVKEALGYEQGLWRTLVDLRRKPKDVLDGYLASDRKYVSPFKLLTTSLSLWLLINGLLVDWYTIWSQIFTVIMDLEDSVITWVVDFDPVKQAEFDRKLLELKGPMLSMVSRIAGDLFSRWYVPFAILSVIGTSWLFTRLNPETGLSLRTVMSAFSYSIGSNIPFYLGISLCFGLHVYLGLGLMVIWSILLLTGKVGKLMYAAPAKFFEDQGKPVERNLIRASFMVTFVLMAILVIGYIIYFNR